MQTTTLLAACPATAIPAGSPVTLPAGLNVVVLQTLGGAVTLRTAQGLFRLAREHAGAVAGLDSAPVVPLDVAEFSEEAVWTVLRGCFDPEIPVNIVDLGLVYDLAVERTPTGGHRVEVKMTLTAPGCGMGPVIAADARERIAALPSVETAAVHIVWDPQWTPQMISPEGRRVLGLE